jgi:hypothetical protein
MCHLWAARSGFVIRRTGVYEAGLPEIIAADRIAPAIASPALHPIPKGVRLLGISLSSLSCDQAGDDPQMILAL